MSLTQRPRHNTHARPFFASLFSSARHVSRRSFVWKAAGAAVAAALALGLVGAAVIVPTASANTDVSDQNQPSYWQAQYPGSSCYKMDDGFSGSSYVLSAPPANTSHVAVIVKAGSPSSTEVWNNVFDATHNTMPATGVTVTTYESAKGISHIIACTVVTPSAEVHSTALYLYKKLDSTKPASWENSGKQTRIATWDGWLYATVFPGSLPADVCGDGWAVQQDQVRGAQSIFPLNIEYPVDNIGWPPIVAAQHRELSTLVTVPPCGTVVTTPGVATADFTVGAATCGVAGTVTSYSATNATHTPATIVDGEYVATFTALENFLFANNTDTLVVTKPVPAALASQSTDRTLPCYTPPTCSAQTSDTSTPFAPNGWAKDDSAPTFSADGIVLSTPTATDHVNYYHGTSTKLSAVSGLSYSVTNNSAGPTASYQLRIFTTGTTGFDTLVWEPYQNGKAIDASGTFTNLADGYWWSTHPSLTNNVAPQSHPETLDTILAAIPDAVVIGYGVNLGSGNAGAVSTVTAVSFICHATTFGATPVSIETDPKVVSQVCIANEIETTLASAYITVALTDHVTYSITGTTDDNVAVNIPTVDKTKTELAPGSYTVTATAAQGWVLTGKDVGPWPLTVDPYDGVCQQGPTLAPIPTGVTSTNQVCTVGNATGGTITVGHVDDADFFNVGIDYFINGTKVTSQTTTVAAGTYKVTAVADPNGDASVDGESAWTITIASPSAACGDLKTLAFTGADGSMGGMLIVALFLLLGGAGVYTASRFRSRES